MQKKLQIILHRVITMLDRREMDFLDKLGKDALFSTGHKLSYNEILKGLVDFAMEMGLSGEKIDSLETIKKRLVELARKEIKESIDKVNEYQGGRNEKSLSQE